MLVCFPFLKSLGWRVARSCWFGLFYLTWVYCAPFGVRGVSPKRRVYALLH